MEVQTLIPNPSVEARDVRILDGLSGPDKGVRDAMVVDPEVQGLARELRAFVGGDCLR